MNKKTALFWDERYLKHDTGPFHPERPARLTAIKEILNQDHHYQWLAPKEATVEQLLRVHSQAHINDVLKQRGRGGYYLDGDTPGSVGSVDAALLAAGGVIEAVKVVDAGVAPNAFVFPRPPGHHAESDHAMGFCFFNNIAIAAEYLINDLKKKRVAIMDFDVHHGNGTQHSFYDRSDVLFLSTHRFPFYPGTGDADEKGQGEGLGYTVNVPLDDGAGDEDLQRAFETAIIPAIDNYKPEFILVSAGYDAHQRDPLGGLRVSKDGFRLASQALTDLAKKHCGGKIVYVLEGGYDLKGLQEGVEATLLTL